MQDAVWTYVCILLALAGVLAAKVLRSKRRLSRKQLDELREWRAGRTETRVQAKIAGLERTLDALRQKRKAEARAKQREAQWRRCDELRDARGQAIYGDEWDPPEGGVKDLLALTDLEVQALRQQAARHLATPPEVDADLPPQSAVDQIRAAVNGTAKVVPLPPDDAVVDDKIHERDRQSSWRRPSPRVVVPVDSDTLV